ncbi:MAG: hypothetical protein P1U75_05790 [Antarcticimicrobium sp.]|uniref:hypothetical protein n=1 Tax=Antarcticimicrobium sp. TaxID=2824147 RepID=UPI0026320755|nr:hypothetical protein [Antarcticimicrobium sp.]MDF1716169.1 hypothetical protein [Antarcticimicrobium sp.]
MQISASLSDTTATIAVKHMNTNTSLTITDASNLAADLAMFTDPEAPSVDDSSFTMTGADPAYYGMKHWWVDVEKPETPHPGYYRDRSRQILTRGYLIDTTDDGASITDLATNGTMTIPRDQIASIIAQLNA